MNRTTNVCKKTNPAWLGGVWKEHVVPAKRYSICLRLRLRKCRLGRRRKQESSFGGRTVFRRSRSRICGRIKAGYLAGRTDAGLSISRSGQQPKEKTLGFSFWAT